MLIKLLSFLIVSCFTLFNPSVLAGGDSMNWDSPPSSATSLPPFFKIACTHNLTVRLKNTEGTPSLLTTHQPENKLVVSEVIDGTLYLTVVKQQEDKPAGSEPLALSLTTGPLKAIAVSGQCEIEASKIKSYGIELLGEDNGQIYMEGDVRVTKIIAQGNSYIEVLWANSDRLYMNAFGTSAIKIAGIAKEILTKTFGKAYMDAQYLRANRVNVLVKQSGFAQVFPLCEMRAFAEDTGRIDYFTVPNNAVSITQSSGNVLWMGYRN